MNKTALVRLIVVAVALIFAGSESKRFHSIAGPFKIVVRRIDKKCPLGMEGNNSMNYTFRDVRTKPNQPKTYSGNLTVPFDVNDSIAVRVLIASWSNMGGWKDNAYVFNIKRGCFFLSRFGRAVWYNYLLSVYGEIAECPFYPGIFRFENLTVREHGLPVKEFLYGRWRIDILGIDPKDEVILCIRGYGDTIPA